MPTATTPVTDKLELGKPDAAPREIVKMESVINAGFLTIKCEGSVHGFDDEKALADRTWLEVQMYEGVEKILLDLREVGYQSGPIDKQRAVEYYKKTFPQEVKRLNLALVIKPRFYTLTRFWEDYAKSQGFDWRVFQDIGDAMAYLIPED